MITTMITMVTQYKDKQCERALPRVPASWQRRWKVTKTCRAKKRYTPYPAKTKTGCTSVLLECGRYDCLQARKAKEATPFTSSCQDDMLFGYNRIGRVSVS